MRPVPIGRTTLTLVAIVCVPALVGCGFSGNSSVSESTGSSGTALQFADCMRSHGVPQFPDPGSSAGARIRPPLRAQVLAGFRVRGQDMRQARARWRPEFGGCPGASASDVHAALVWAQCVRKHGEPNFPDPSTTARAGLSFRGIVFPVGAEFNAQSPAFKQAQAACGSGPGAGKVPPGGDGL